MEPTTRLRGSVQCPDMRKEAAALLEREHARLLADSAAAAESEYTAAAADADVSASRSPPPRA